MSHLRLAVFLIFLFACTDRTEPPGPPASEDPDEVTLEDESSDLELEPALDFAESRGSARTALSGGATTVFDESEEAFESPAPNLQGENIERHELGDVAFGWSMWTGPASTAASARSSTTSPASPVTPGTGADGPRSARSPSRPCSSGRV